MFPMLQLGSVSKGLCRFMSREEEKIKKEKKRAGWVVCFTTVMLSTSEFIILLPPYNITESHPSGLIQV